MIFEIVFQALLQAKGEIPVYQCLREEQVRPEGKAGSAGVRFFIFLNPAAGEKGV